MRLISGEGCELRPAGNGTGDGVFATRDFEVGETVVVGIIERRLQRNDSHATQISQTEFVLHAGFGPLVNHSCDPNCGVRVNDTGAFDIVARGRIVTGEEITFDYAMRNDAVEHFPARCRCGSAFCRGSVSGWKDLPEDRKRAYDGFVAPYLLEIERDRQAGRVRSGAYASRKP